MDNLRNVFELGDLRVHHDELDSATPLDSMAPVTRDVLFQIGQIVHHLRYDYRGVIVGYERTCMADDEWYEYQTKGKDYKPTKEQPWYHVLVEGAAHQTYVAQQNLEPSKDRHRIDHPLVDRIFATFLEGRYHKENLN